MWHSAACRIEPEAQEDVGGEFVGLVGLRGVVGMVQLAHLNASDDQSAPQGTGHAAQAAALADGHVATGQRRGGMAQLGPGPDRRDQLGLLVAALESHELAQRGASEDAVDREAGVALELGQGP